MEDNLEKNTENRHLETLSDEALKQEKEKQKALEKLVKQEKHQHAMTKFKIIFHVVAIIALLIFGMYLGMQLSLKMNQWSWGFQRVMSWALFIIIALAIVAIPLAIKMNKGKKHKSEE